MSVSPKELQALLPLLSSPGSKLEEISQLFDKTFSRSDHFRLCCALSVLLEEKDILSGDGERLVSLFLLYHAYSDVPMQSNPFLAVVVAMAARLSPSLLGTGESFMVIRLLDLIRFPPQPALRLHSSVLDLTPAEICVMGAQLPIALPSQFDAIVALVHAQTAKLPLSCSRDLYTVVATPTPAQGTSYTLDAAATLAKDASSLLCDTRVLYSSAPPPMIRPVPSLYPCEQDEMPWLHVPAVNHAIQWDSTMCLDSSDPNTAQTLLTMEKAFKTPLSPAQQSQVLAELDRNPALVYHIGLTPANLPSLVQLNRMVALEILLHLISRQQMTEFFSALVNMEPTLQSMEVVSGLTQRVELPPELLHFYITNCIAHCESTDDKVRQARKVKLVCVFLASLILHKIIRVQDLSPEVETFCIAQGTPVTYACGLARPIDSAVHSSTLCLPSVLGCSRNPARVLLGAQVSQWMDRGVRRVIELTLQDGRLLRCTPDHRVLLSGADQWCPAGALQPGTRIRVGLEAPCDDPDSDTADYLAFDFNGHLPTGKAVHHQSQLHPQQHRHQHRERCLALARLLGADIDDVSILRSTIDRACLEADRALVSDSSNTIAHSDTRNAWQPALSTASLFSLLSDTACPLPVVREFLAALCGRIALVPTLTPTGFLNDQTTVLVPLPRTVASTTLVNLFARCGVTVQSHNQPTPSSRSDTPTFLSIVDTHTFLHSIGLRYCLAHWHTLSIAIAYQRTLTRSPDLPLTPAAFLSTTLPTFSHPQSSPSTLSLAVESVRDIGQCLPVYDLSVPSVESFVASGIVVHNCLQFSRIREAHSLLKSLRSGANESSSSTTPK